MLQYLRGKKGSVIVIVALGVTAMMGFGALVVDVGNLYLNKTRLTNMADAAALAGVQDLPSNSQLALSNAYSYAAQNGMNSDVVGVSVSNNNTVITVTAVRKVPLFLARIFKLTSSDVTAEAAASISSISGASGIVPFGIVKQQFTFGQTYNLKAGAGGGYNGNYRALALGGTGASVYQRNIKNGYSGQLNIGDWIATETGNMSGPTNQGVGDRIRLDPTTTFITVEKGSPRIVVVPVINSIEVDGRGDVLIVGFAAFFLEGTGGQGTDNYITGKFRQMVVPGDISGEATNYGLYGSTLIK